jgi:hypothetical protein
MKGFSMGVSTAYTSEMTILWEELLMAELR